MVADFKAMEPILTQLAKSGSDLPNSLQILLTYPFPDSVLGAIKGDYLNVFIETNFRSLPANCGAIGCAWPQLTGQVGGTSPTYSASKVKPAPTILPPTSSPIPGVPEPTIAVPSPSPSAPSPTAPSPSPANSDPTPTPDPTATGTSDESLTPKDGDQ